MKKIATLVVMVGMSFGFAFFRTSNSPHTIVEPITPTEATFDREPASQTLAAKKSPTISYFHSKLESIPAVSKIYQHVLNKLPSGYDSELIAIYVAEGIARNGGSDFAKFMTDLQTDLRDHSQELFNLISAQEENFKNDPYAYQMLLNLAARLDLPPEMKAQLLGDAMSIHFIADPKMGLTAMSTNITNAFILMKNNGISADQAAPYIQRGVQVNQDDPKALVEFAARANAYYPGSVSN